MNETARCDRFERQGLLMLERGQPLEEHFEVCADCLASRRAHAALQARLRAPRDEAEEREMQPPGDWQARVFAGIARRQTSRRRRWFFAWVVAPSSVALLLWIAVRFLPPAVPDAGRDWGLETRVIQGSVVSRGLESQPGDRMQLQVPAASAAAVELRLYRGGRTLMARCGSAATAAASGIPACTVMAGELQLDYQLPGRGRYQGLVMVFESPGSLGEITDQGLDPDAAAALAAGAEVRLGDVVVVR